jgi:hypothetical protein
MFLKTIRLSATLALKLTRQCRTPEMQFQSQMQNPKWCKVQQQGQLRMQDFNLAKLKQTRASNKQQTSE